MAGGESGLLGGLAQGDAASQHEAESGEVAVQGVGAGEASDYREP